MRARQIQLDAMTRTSQVTLQPRVQSAYDHRLGISGPGPAAGIKEELMIEVMNSVGAILSFDGRVIEQFPLSGSPQRVHIHQLEAIEVKERRKGLELSWKTRTMPFTMANIDPSARAAVDQFVAQVKAARGLP
jgi:hypothetical protein